MKALTYLGIAIVAVGCAAGGSNEMGGNSSSASTELSGSEMCMATLCDSQLYGPFAADNEKSPTTAQGRKDIADVACADACHDAIGSCDGMYAEIIGNCNSISMGNYATAAEYEVAKSYCEATAQGYKSICEQALDMDVTEKAESKVEKEEAEGDVAEEEEAEDEVTEESEGDEWL